MYNPRGFNFEFTIPQYPPSDLLPTNDTSSSFFYTAFDNTFFPNTFPLLFPPLLDSAYLLATSVPEGLPLFQDLLGPTTNTILPSPTQPQPPFQVPFNGGVSSPKMNPTFKKKASKKKPWPKRRRSSLQRVVHALDYNDITVLELKALLKNAGNKVSGKKDALIHRLKTEFE